MILPVFLLTARNEATLLQIKQDILNRYSSSLPLEVLTVALAWLFFLLFCVHCLLFKSAVSSSEKAQVWIVVCDMGLFNTEAMNAFKEVLAELKGISYFPLSATSALLNKSSHMRLA